jgi:MFS family permease
VLNVSAALRALAVFAAAAICAVAFGVGVPLGWVWVASQLQPNVGQATGQLAALVLIAGPLASYLALTVIVGRFNQPRDARPPRMTWNRSRDDIRDKTRPITAFEQVVLLAILIVAALFEVWFFFFAHTTPWGSG